MELFKVFIILRDLVLSVAVFLRPFIFCDISYQTTPGNIPEERRSQPLILLIFYSGRLVPVISRWSFPSSQHKATCSLVSTAYTQTTLYQGIGHILLKFVYILKYVIFLLDFVLVLLKVYKEKGRKFSERTWFARSTWSFHFTAGISRTTEVTLEADRCIATPLQLYDWHIGVAEIFVFP